MAKKNKNILVYGIIGVVIVAIIILGIIFFFRSNNSNILDTNNTTNNSTNTDNADATNKSNTTPATSGIQSIIQTDASKIKQKIEDWNSDTNVTSGLFTSIDVTKKDNSYLINYKITDDIKSVFFLNMVGIGTGLKVYDTDSGFEKINIIYLNNKNEKLGEVTIPNKAIKDVYDYNKANPDTNLIDNPYLTPYGQLVTSLYDPSIPQLIPTSMAESEFGSEADNADEIDEALTKQVTHLEIDCWGAKNWDADAEDDGITYYIRPTADDGTIVPLEGTYTTEAYSIKRTDSWDYIKDEKVYTKIGTLEGSSRFGYFDIYDGYNIGLDWSEVTPYLSSDEDNGYLYVTFTDKQNKTYSAKIENSYSSCDLRES